MSDIKNKFENLKDKVEGEIQETFGKMTGNEELELKGKIKLKVVETKEKISDIKDDAIDKINNKIDKSNQE